MPVCRRPQILRHLIIAAIGRPKLALALSVLILAALASTMSYAGFLVVGVVADHLGTSRSLAGLLLGGLFARFPSISKGKLRTVGLLPKPVRRPFIASLFALCLLNFVLQGEHLPSLFTGFALAFLLAYPWLRKALFNRMLSPLFKFTGRHRAQSLDEKVIDGEFKIKGE